jgi:hypothetical protein
LASTKGADAGRRFKVAAVDGKGTEVGLDSREFVSTTSPPSSLAGASPKLPSPPGATTGATSTSTRALLKAALSSRAVKLTLSALRTPSSPSREAFTGVGSDTGEDLPGVSLEVDRAVSPGVPPSGTSPDVPSPLPLILQGGTHPRNTHNQGQLANEVSVSEPNVQVCFAVPFVGDTKTQS